MLKREERTGRRGNGERERVKGEKEGEREVIYLLIDTISNNLTVLVSGDI